MEDDYSNKEISSGSSPTTTHSPSVDQLLDPLVLLDYIKRIIMAVLAGNNEDFNESFGSLDAIKLPVKQLLISFITETDPLVIFIFKDELPHHGESIFEI